jgi:cell wall-associated NlpC family hydrolase
VIETTAVQVGRAGDVDLMHALGEGEGYTSVAQRRGGRRDRVRAAPDRQALTVGRRRPGRLHCSSLVYAAYAAEGIRIARTTFGWRQDGTQVPLSQIQPGDLLFSADSDGTPPIPVTS